MPILATNLIRKMWGYAAGGPYITNPIPDTTATPGRASFELGAPPLNMTSKVAGGIPPFGQDYNGILAMITNNLAALNAGQVNAYNSAFATDIGGYAKGAMLQMADGTGWWICTVANNTTDPDANGAGWEPVYRYDWTQVTGLVGGTYTLTKMQARSRVIVMTGVLGSNQAVEFPTDLREWMVINSTTGAFTLTCKTTSGTGVVVPNGGGSNATQIYGDGTNIYFAAAPTSITVDQAATPLSVAQRTGTGGLLANSFSDGTDFQNSFGGTRSVTPTSISYPLPGGLILKVGRVTVTINGGTQLVNFPVAFPTACVGAFISGSGSTDANAQDNNAAIYSGSVGAASFRLTNAAGGDLPYTAYWFAIGY
jgi:hypothetical protein